MLCYEKTAQMLARRGTDLRILLVEDDTLLGEGLFAGLKRQQHTVDWVKNGEAAITAVNSTDYNVLVLDLGLPKMSGLEVLSSIRRKGNDLPVLILTARDAVTDRVSGLDAGADDYMIKPFEFDELCARIRALSRRVRGSIVETLSYKSIELDKAAHAVTLAGKPVALSRHEFAILEELLSATGQVFSKARLEEKLYSWSDEVESNTIEVYIHYLRKKFGADLIKTVRGVGYIIPKETMMSSSGQS